MKRLLSLLLSLTVIISLSVPAFAAGPSFLDVSQSHWAYQFVEQAAKEGWVSGVGNGKFNPNGKVTGAEWYTMVIRAFFPDKIPDEAPAGQWYSGKWYAPYAAAGDQLEFAERLDDYATSQDIAERPLTRAEMAAVIFKVLSWYDVQAPEDKLLEAEQSIPDINNYALEDGRRGPIIKCYALGILAGADSKGTFNGEATSVDDLDRDVKGLYTLTDKANGDDKSGNDKFNAVEFKSNDNYTVKANGTLSASVAKDDTNMTVNGTKVYMNKDTNYIAVEKYGDDLDVSTAVGGMKCAKDDADKVLVISNKDDSRTAVYVLYIGDDLSSSVVSDEVVYVAEKSDEQNADGWVTTLYFMENNSSDDVTVETQVEPGFYYYDVDEDDVYSLEGVTGLGNDDVDDDTNGWDTLVINESSIYSTQNLLTKDNFSDIAFGSAKVIDSRDNIDSDKIYDKEITSVSNLKNAAKNGNITIRVYVTDGEITFIDVIGAGDGVKAPVIGTQPQDATVTAGSITGELTVAATGNDLTYQWYKDGAKISNETKATLTIPTDLTAGTYTFYVEVTSSKDGYTNTVKSTEVTVTVKPVAPVYSAGSVAGDVSDKTITITNSTNLPAGEYKLYKGDDTVLATVTLNDEGTALKFTKVEGLAESETQFQITVTINGVESDKSADIAITPVA